MAIPEPDYGLKPGDELIQCSKGFTWTATISTNGPRVPDKVIVVKEYPRFVEVEAHFEKNGGAFYHEAINKAAVQGGDCYFLRMPKYE